jgi:hypothetical protein
MKKCEYNGEAFQMFTDFKKAYNSVMRKGLCNILKGGGIPTKQKQGYQNVFSCILTLISSVVT